MNCPHNIEGFDKVLACTDCAMTKIGLQAQLGLIESIKCIKCEGSGYYGDHDPNDPHENGCSRCPVQFQCDDCMATGFYSPALTTKEQEIRTKLEGL